MYNETRNINGTDFNITIYDTASDRVVGIHAFIDNDNEGRFHAFAEAVELNEWEGCTWVVYEDTQEAALCGVVEMVEDSVCQRQAEMMPMMIGTLPAVDDTIPALEEAFAEVEQTKLNLIQSLKLADERYLAMKEALEAARNFILEQCRETAATIPLLERVAAALNK